MEKINLISVVLIILAFMFSVSAVFVVYRLNKGINYAVHLTIMLISVFSLCFTVFVNVFLKEESIKIMPDSLLGVAAIVLLGMLGFLILFVKDNFFNKTKV